MLELATLEEYKAFIELKRQLHEVLFNGNPSSFKKEMDEFGIEQYKNEIENRHIYFLKHNNEYIGYSQVNIYDCGIIPSMNSKKIMFIVDICIDKSHRRKGYGSIIFDELKKIAKEEHCVEIGFNVFAFNEEALVFYKKMNCQIEGIGMKYQLR